MSLNLSIQEWVLVCTLAGALHVFAPDHWFPSSVLAWQRGWIPLHTLCYGALSYFFHVFLGYLLYLFIGSWISNLGSEQFITFGLGLMVLATVIRSLRFRRAQRVLEISRWGAKSVILALSLLGPCEVVVPMFAKSKELGIGYFIPFTAFLIGTWLVGIPLLLYGRNLWNRPFWLPFSVRWMAGSSAVLPLSAGLFLSLAFIVLH